MKFDKGEPSTHARESESSLVSSSQPSSSPQQDQYLRVLAIVTLVSALLPLLWGLSQIWSSVSNLIILLMAPGYRLYQSFQLSISDVLTLIIAIVGGGLLLFQCIRFLKHVPSSRFTTPLWICAIAYIAVLILRVVITQNISLSITDPGMLASGTPADIFASILLIGLEGFLVCLVLILLVIRWLSSPSDIPTWRRMIATVAYSACAAIGVGMITARQQLAGEDLYMQSTPFSPQCIGDFLSWTCLTQTAVWSSYIVPFLIKTLLLVGLIPSLLALLLPKVRTQAQAMLLGLACGAGIVVTTHITDIDPSLLPLLPLEVDYFIIVSARALVICTCSAFVTVGWYLLVHKQPQALVKALLYWFGSLLASWLFLLLERAFATAEPLRSIIMILILIIALACFFLVVRSLKRMTEAERQIELP